MTDKKVSGHKLILQKEQLQEAETLRRAAFVATSLSVIASVMSVILIPMLYSYVQYVQVKLEDELDFCRTRSRHLGEEWILFSNEKDLEISADRFKRENFSAIPERLKQAIYVGQHDPHDVRPKRQVYKPSPPGVKPANFEQVYGSSQGGRSCCSCGVGQTGPSGPPGEDGNDGKEGLPGPDGDNGMDAPPAKKLTADDFCFVCPGGAAGPIGGTGPKGVSGNDGSHGVDGVAGYPAPTGPVGAPGTPGQAGQPGQKGDSGPPGELVEVPGIPGPVGVHGQSGPPGKNGKDGLVGRPGTPGVAGPMGDAGLAGSNGQPASDGHRGVDGLAGALGGCDHCPPARAAPGF